MSVRRAAPGKFTGLVVVLAVASAAGPASAWDAFERCKEHDPTRNSGRGNTHLFIVNRAIELMSRSGNRIAEDAARYMNVPACRVAWQEGIHHADLMDSWMDGAGDTSGSHFFNATATDLSMCATYFNGPTCVSGAFDARTNAGNQISQFVTGRTLLWNMRAGRKYGYHTDPRPCFSLGLALHFMTDVTMPFHANSFSGASAPPGSPSLMLHPHFEAYVPSIQHRYVQPNWVAPPSSTPEQALIAASRDAATYHTRLMDAIMASGGVGVINSSAANAPFYGPNFRHNPAVDAVTGAVLRLAQSNTASYLHAVFLANPIVLSRPAPAYYNKFVRIEERDCPRLTETNPTFGAAFEASLLQALRVIWDSAPGRLVRAVYEAFDAAISWLSHRFEPSSVACFEAHVKPAARILNRSAIAGAEGVIRAFWRAVTDSGFASLTQAQKGVELENTIIPKYAEVMSNLRISVQEPGDSGRTKIGTFFDSSESRRNADALYWQTYWGGPATGARALWPAIYDTAIAAYRQYAGVAGMALPLEISRWAPSGNSPWLPAPLAPALANCLHEAARFRITASAANLGAAVTVSATATPNRLGCFQHFAAGSLYSYGGRAPVAVLRGLLEAWGAHGYERGALGFPFMAAAACAAPNDRDQRQVFQGGQLVWRAATSRAEFFLRPRTIGMYGDCRSDQQIITAKLDEAALRANLGPATGGLEQLSNFGGRFYLRRYRGGNAYAGATEGESTFVGPDGALVLGARLAEYAQAYAVRTALLNAWAGPLRGTLRWEHGLGLPTTGELACTAPGGDKVQHFERGRIVWRAATSRAELYEEPFWWPNPQDVSPYGSELLELRRPRVVGDGLDCSPSPNQSVVDCAYVLRSQRVIGELWTALGSPTGAVAPTPTRPGCFQVYQRGNVYWRPGGVQPKKVVGSILAAFGAQRWEQGPLGLPLTEEQACAQPSRADRWQQFDGGRLVWRAATNRVERYPNPTSVGTAGDCRRPAGSVLNDALILTPILLLPGLPKR